MSARPGFALLTTLVLTMALALFATAMLTLAAREADVAAAVGARAAAGTSAETAVRAAMAGWSTRRYRSMVLAEVVVVAADSTTQVGVRRLAADVWLLEASVSHPARGGSVATRSASLVRTVAPDEVAATFPAAVTAETVAHVHADGSVIVDDCGAAGSTAGIMAPLVTFEAGATVAGSPPFLESPPLSGSHLLRSSLVHRLATVRLQGGVISPGPISDGVRCVPDTSNWGSGAPNDVCHDHIPLVHSTATLEVQGGEGRALLVVDGDLRLQDIHFEGAILVTGQLVVGDRSSVRGAVRAAAVEIAGGTVRFDGCILGEVALAGGLDGAFRPGDRLWIPTF